MKSYRSLFLSLCLLLVGSVSVWGQKEGLFIRAGGGYHLSAAGTAIDLNEFADSSGYTEELFITTLGGGIPFEVDLGYWFSEHLGFELGINFLFGGEKTVRRVINPVANIEATAWTRQCRLSPSFLIRSGGEDIRLFGRAGLIVPVVGTTYLDIDADVTIGPTQQRTINKYKNTGKFSIGFQGGIGVMCDITDFLALSLEVQGVEIRIPTDKREMYEAIRFNSDGTQENLLTNGEITEYARLINYHYELDGSHNSPITQAAVLFDQPADELATTSSYSSVGLNLGVMLTF